MSTLKIKPVNEAGDHRTGTLTGITAAEIAIILGFKANVQDDQVKYSWGFTCGKDRCGIWDYYQSYRYKSFSTFGPGEIFKTLFGNRYQDG